jgi:hypothetical protein
MKGVGAGGRFDNEHDEYGDHEPNEHNKQCDETNSDSFVHGAPLESGVAEILLREDAWRNANI